MKVDELKTNLATGLDNGPGGARTRGRGGLERWVNPGRGKWRRGGEGVFDFMAGERFR